MERRLRREAMQTLILGRRLSTSLAVNDTGDPLEIAGTTHAVDKYNPW